MTTYFTPILPLTRDIGNSPGTVDGWGPNKQNKRKNRVPPLGKVVEGGPGTTILSRMGCPVLASPSPTVDGVLK